MNVKLATATKSFIAFSLPASTTQKDTLLCFDKTPKTDGHYTLEIKSATVDSTQSFGYYTNGYPLCSKIEIVIERGNFMAKEVH